MSARVDHGVTSGTFSLDGETFDVDNNIWVVGDDTECVVIDAPHSVDDILAVVGELHRVPFEMGLPRVYSVLKLDERRDREQTLEDKVESVRRLLD